MVGKTLNAWPKILNFLLRNGEIYSFWSMIMTFVKPVWYVSNVPGIVSNILQIIPNLLFIHNMF